MPDTPEIAAARETVERAETDHAPLEAARVAAHQEAFDAANKNRLAHDAAAETAAALEAAQAHLAALIKAADEPEGT